MTRIQILNFLLVSTRKGRGLDGEYVVVLDHWEDSSPGCRVFVPCQSEGIGREVEGFIDFAHKEGENPWLNLILLAAIRKDVVLLAVTMEIETANYSLLELQLLYFIHDRTNLRMQLFDWTSPHAIEVESWKVASEVAINNSVNIDHRKDVEFIVGKQVFCLWFWLLC